MLQQLRGHAAAVNQVAWIHSCGSLCLISAGDDGVLLLWSAPASTTKSILGMGLCRCCGGCSCHCNVQERLLVSRLAQFDCWVPLGGVFAQIREMERGSTAALIRKCFLRRAQDASHRIPVANNGG